MVKLVYCFIVGDVPQSHRKVLCLDIYLSGKVLKQHRANHIIDKPNKLGFFFQPRNGLEKSVDLKSVMIAWNSMSYAARLLFMFHDPPIC